MTKPCITCHHKADSHQRGLIILESGSKLRPYSGKCKEKGCSCLAYLKINGLVITKTEVKQIFHLKKRFAEAKSRDRKRMIYGQMKDWWNDICIKYDLDIKRILSIKKDGRIILKSKKLLTIEINNNFSNLATHEQKLNVQRQKGRD